MGSRNDNVKLDAAITETSSYVNQVIDTSTDYFLKGKDKLGFALLHQLISAYRVGVMCKDSLLSKEEEILIARRFFKCITTCIDIGQKEYVVIPSSINLFLTDQSMK